MKKRKLTYVIFRHSPTLLRWMRKCKKYEKKDAPIEKKHRFAIKVIDKLHKIFKVKIKVTGLENIPKDLGGCVFMGNHQGQDDGPVVLSSLRDYTVSVLMNKTILDNLFFKKVTFLLNGLLLDHTDLKQQLEVYKELAKNVEAGSRYIIFPEGKHDNNKNELLEFNTGCLTPVIKAKADIYPFCLYDTWPIFNDDYKQKGHINCECHFLEPIKYREYEGLKKPEIIELIKNRIQNKLNEIKLEKGENSLWKNFK